MIPRGARRALLTSCLGVALAAAWAASNAAPPTAIAAAPATQADTAEHLPSSPTLFEGGLTGNTDLVLLPGARRPAPRPTVVAATRATAGAAAVANVFLDTALMRQALPALVRAEVVATRAGPRPDAWPDRLIAWEVEIPLFNLQGRGWLRQRDDGAELTLTEGAFAPGRLRFRVAAASRGTGTVATCEVQIEPRSANWIFRRVARHDPWSEAAISAATAWVLVRAVALRADAAPGSAPARPRGPIRAPAADRLDGAAVRDASVANLRAAGTVAAVRRAPDGRLGWASVGVVVPGSPAAVGAVLATPETWRVFPGWGSVKRKAGSAPENTPAVAGARGNIPAAPMLVAVEDDVPFVDFEAVWSVTTVPALRATAVEGNIRGAVFGWDTFPADVAGSSLAVLSTHPRLDAAGYIERKLVAAEPLLEHAFAVALAYVDAAAVADSMRAVRSTPPHRDSSGN